MVHFRYLDMYSVIIYVHVCFSLKIVNLFKINNLYFKNFYGSVIALNVVLVSTVQQSESAMCVLVESHV